MWWTQDVCLSLSVFFIQALLVWIRGRCMLRPKSIYYYLFTGVHYLLAASIILHMPEKRLSLTIWWSILFLLIIQTLPLEFRYKCHIIICMSYFWDKNLSHSRLENIYCCENSLRPTDHWSPFKRQNPGFVRMYAQYTVALILTVVQWNNFRVVILSVQFRNSYQI